MVAEKRQEGTMSESSQSEKTLEVEIEEDFSRNTERPVRTVKRPMWMTSGDYDLPSARTAIAGSGGPTPYWEVVNSAQEWVTAMKEEMDALVANDMWELIDCPKNVKVVDNRWVLQTKLNADSFTKRLRARLVAKGHVQKAGTDMIP